MHNLSWENEFYLHENEKSFPYQTNLVLIKRPGGTPKWPISGTLFKSAQSTKNALLTFLFPTQEAKSR